MAGIKILQAILYEGENKMNIPAACVYSLMFTLLQLALVYVNMVLYHFTCYGQQMIRNSTLSQIPQSVIF